MNHTSVRATGVITVAFALISVQAQTTGERLNFVSCPIVRDTSTVPCWLTEHEGELYYMGIQTDVSADFQPPYLGHRVLVEATASDAPRICGGVVLDPIVISVMPELDASCSTRLPADDRYTIDFNPRPPGPSDGRLAFEERYMPAAAPASAITTDVPGEFLLTFDFDAGVAFRHPPRIMEIADHIREADARRVTVTGSRGATRLSDGSVLTERDGIAQKRAEQLAELLTGLDVGVPVEAAWSDEPVAADGVDDWRKPQRAHRPRTVAGPGIAACEPGHRGRAIVPACAT